MIKEKFVIEVGTKSFKYLSESVRGYNLTDDLDYAMKITNEEQAKSYFQVPCLKNKTPRLRKIKITYELE